jgi:hypothetical protein
MAVALERLDRRALVDDARVVEDERRPRLEHREALARGPVGGEDARLAALDARAADAHDGDEVDAVAVRAFGSRPADAVGGVDAELMRFDEPRLRAAQRRREPRERDDDALPRRRREDLRRDRLEPALDAAVERVVFDGLPMRALGDEPDLAAVDDEARMAATASSRASTSSTASLRRSRASTSRTR